MAPKEHVVQYRGEALPGLGERVLHLRRDLPVYLAMDEAVGLQLAQLLGERRLGYPIEPAHELAEALHLVGVYVSKDEYLPLSADNGLKARHRLASSDLALVRELVLCHMLSKVLFTPNSAVYVTTSKLIPYLHFAHGRAILISDT